MSAQNYFRDLAAEEELLAIHELDHYPTAPELLQIIKNVDKKVDALACSQGMRFERGIRGRVHLVRMEVTQ